MGAGSTKFGVMEKWIMMDDTVAGPISQEGICIIIAIVH